MYIQSICCIWPFSTFYMLWCTAENWSWHILKDQNVGFFPPIKYNTLFFDLGLSKYYYIQVGFKNVSIGQAPEHIFYINGVKWIRRQYGLCHYVTGTIHSALGDSYNQMAILVSNVEICFHYGIVVSWLLFYRALG